LSMSRVMRERNWLYLFGLLALGIGPFGPSTLRADAAPLIERVEPTAGPIGSLVRVSGRRLRGDSRVFVGAAALTIELSTPNLITARIPADAVSGPIRVETRAGSANGPEFSITAAAPTPIIRRVQPLRGAPGSLFTIEGEHFSLQLAQNTVLFGDVPAIVSAASPTQLRVIVPNVSGTQALKLRVSGAAEVRAPLEFSVSPGLILRELLPPRAAGPIRLELRGSGFPPGARVSLAGVALRVLELAPQRALVQVPASAKGGSLRISGPQPGAAGAELPFEVLVPLAIDRLQPQAGAPGTIIRVTGKGFGDDLGAIRARLGESALAVTELSETSVSLRVPVGAITDKLTIEIAEHGRALSPVEFAVTEPLRLAADLPRGGPSGSAITLIGAGFAPRASDNSVYFAGEPAHVLAATQHELRVEVPAARTGPIEVQVGDTRLASSAPFVVTNPPQVREIKPVQVVATKEFTVLGTGFGAQPALVRVSLAGLPLKVIAVRDDAIVVQAPDLAEIGELRVHVALQGSAAYAQPLRILPRD
jgi:hypothetical protein